MAQDMDQKQQAPGERRTRNRTHRTMLSLALVSAVAMVAAACGSGSSGSTSSGSGSTATGGKALKSLVVGIPSPAVTVFSANYAIGQYTGCYAQAGYKFSTVVTTNPSQLVAALHRKAVDVGVPGSDQFLNMLSTIKSSGGGLPLTAFYELDYPFKYGLAVKPGSSITSLSQLVGKTVGVDVLSDSSKAAFQALLKANGVDPSKVNVIATGVGAASGQALDSGKTDALFYYDVGFGTILQAGIPLRFVTVNGKAPYLGVSGIMAVANSNDLTANKAKYAALAKCTTEGDIFVQTNPAAAAYIMLKMYPSLGKPGVSLEKQVQALTLPLMLRQKLMHSQDPTVNYGVMNGDEFTQDLTDLLGKPANSVDVNSVFTNSLVPTLTAAEVAAVKKSATDFKMPGISGTIPLPTLPANAP